MYLSQDLIFMISVYGLHKTIENAKKQLKKKNMGLRGLEPRLIGLEPIVLPLHHNPFILVIANLCIGVLDGLDALLKLFCKKRPGDYHTLIFGHSQFWYWHHTQAGRSLNLFA